MHLGLLKPEALNDLAAVGEEHCLQVREQDSLQHGPRDLKRGIRDAKSDYRRRTEDHLNSNKSRQVLQGVQHLTNYSEMLNVMPHWQRRSFPALR